MAISALTADTLVLVVGADANVARFLQQWRH